MRLYTLALHKAYFDYGFSLTNILKWLIAFFILADQDTSTSLILGFIYAISCYVIGAVAFKIRFNEAEQEVRNQFDLFVKEVRKGKHLNSS